MPSGNIAGPALPSPRVGEGEGGGASPRPLCDMLPPTPIPSPRGGGEAQTFWHQARGHIWGKG